MKNALYYVKDKEDGCVEIRLEPGKQCNQLYFKDNGVGITQDRLDSLFDHFVTDKAEGTGLGLSFCQRVMKSFGGEISVESEFGVYTCFILSFPILADG